MIFLPETFMNKYFARILIFSLPLIACFYIKPVYLLINSKYEKVVAGYETYSAIRKSKHKYLKKKLLLGDSSGYQLFPNTLNDSIIVSLTCNKAIDIVGQFVLLENFLKAGNKVDTVYMIYNSFSFQSNLDEIYTFHYFLKPFYKAEYKTYFTDIVTKQIHKIPYYYLCREPYILTSNWSPNYVSKDTINYSFLSPISLEYLKKIHTLSAENGFEFIIVSPFNSLVKKHLIDQLDRNEIVKNNLNKEFDLYFENMIYLDDSCFLDGFHLKNPKLYTEFYRQKFLK